MEAAIGVPDETLSVVAHSLGAITVLHALDRLPGDWSIRGLVAVSGFAEPLPALPELDPFTASPPDARRLARRILHRTAIVSDDDTVVPPSATTALARLLDARLVTVPGGGHFLADDGFTALEPALRAVQRTS